MEALESVLTFLGSSLCHQLEERSYSIDGFRMPLCARCLGLHLGFLLSAFLMIALKKHIRPGLPRVHSLVIVGLIMLPAMADVLLSYVGILESDNTRRAVTGAMFGAALAFVLIPFIRALLVAGSESGPGQTRPCEWIVLAAASVSASLLAVYSESSEPLFYSVAVAGVIGVFATMFSLVLLFVLLLTDGTQWGPAKKTALSAAAAPLLILLLATVHGALSG